MCDKTCTYTAEKDAMYVRVIRASGIFFVITDLNVPNVSRTYFKQRRTFLVVLREILKSDHSIIGEVYKCETSHLTEPVLSLRLNHKSVEFI